MPPAQDLKRRLNTLRRSAQLWFGLRAALMTLGTTLGAFAIAAMALDRSASHVPLVIAWGVIACTGLATLWWGGRPLRSLAGPRVARLLQRIEPRLSLRVRSAAELIEAPGESSPCLVNAYVHSAWTELSAVPTRKALPIESLWRRDWLLCIGVGLVGLALLLGTGRGPRGTFTLLHPGAQAADGTSLGVVFDRVGFLVAYPHYMQRPSEAVEAGTTVELPPGTSISVTAMTSEDMRQVRMRTPSGVVALRSTAPGQFEGRFILHQAGAVSLRASDDGAHWLEDARQTRIELEPDRSPIVSLDVADTGDEVDLKGLTLRFVAEDDWGLAGVAVVASGPGDDELRQTIWHESALDGDPIRRASAEHALDLRSLSLQPGDHYRVWLEAWDRDDVSGPHRGRSETRELVVASPHSQREQAIASLQELRLTLIHHLAARLTPSADDHDLGPRLEMIGEALANAEQPEGVAASLLASMASHLIALGRSESAARGASARRRSASRATAGVEDDLLSLDDLITSAKLRDAADLARELSELREELTRLVAEMRRAPSEETRRALASAAARVKTRLDELSARLAQGAGPRSGEYLNPSDQQAAFARDAMADLMRALETDDMDAAERSLFLLQTQLEALARGLGQADEAFTTSQFGPRQAALAEAMARLTDLETEQRSLATAAERVRFGAAERALTEGEGALTGPALRASAEAARAALEAIGRRELASSDLRRLERSAAQLRDTRDALSAGDLARAREQARATSASVEGLARDLELAQLMGGSGDPATASARAQRGRAAEARLRELTTAIDQAIPNLRRHLDDRSRSELSAARGRQAHAREAADALAERFADTPDGRPLSANAAGELQSVSQQMHDAEHAFAQPDPIAAGDHSAEAARTLSRLRRELQQAQNRSHRGERRSRAEHVTIHGRGDATGPTIRRERAMDALRRAPPPGYEAALRRYYEGLLR